MTVANPDPKETIPLEDAKVIAVALNNMMAFRGSAHRWLGLGLAAGGYAGRFLERVRELYGEPTTWVTMWVAKLHCLFEGWQSLTIWASEFLRPNERQDHD